MEETVNIVIRYMVVRQRVEGLVPIDESKEIFLFDQFVPRTRRDRERRKEQT